MKNAIKKNPILADGKIVVARKIRDGILPALTLYLSGWDSFRYSKTTFCCSGMEKLPSYWYN